MKTIILILESFEPGNIHRSFYNGIVAACNTFKEVVDVIPLILPRNEYLTSQHYDYLIEYILKTNGCDLLFTLKGEQISYNTLIKFVRKHIKTVTWQIDDPFELIDNCGSKMRKLFPAFYKIYTTSKESINVYYPNIGQTSDRIDFLPFGYDKNNHKNFNLNKIYDVSFVGSSYRERKNTYLDPLCVSKNIKINIFGEMTRRISHKEMIQVVNKSKINLNFSDQPNGYKSLKNRVPEVLGCGQFLLSEYSKDLEELYKLGTELETFNSYKELVDKIEFYLKNDKAREKIAVAGAKAVEKYEYSNLLKPILKKELGL